VCFCDRLTIQQKGDLKMRQYIPDMNEYVIINQRHTKRFTLGQTVCWWMIIFCGGVVNWLIWL